MIKIIKRIPYTFEDGDILDGRRICFKNDGLEDIHIEGTKLTCPAGQDIFKYVIYEELFGGRVERWCLSTEILDLEDPLCELYPIFIKYIDSKGVVTTWKILDNVNMFKQKIVKGATIEENILSKFLFNFLDESMRRRELKYVAEAKEFLHSHFSEKVQPASNSKIYPYVTNDLLCEHHYNFSKKIFESITKEFDPSILKVLIIGPTVISKNYIMRNSDSRIILDISVENEESNVPCPHDLAISGNLNLLGNLCRCAPVEDFSIILPSESLKRSYKSFKKAYRDSFEGALDIIDILKNYLIPYFEEDYDIVSTIIHCNELKEVQITFKIKNGTVHIIFIDLFLTLLI